MVTGTYNRASQITEFLKTDPRVKNVLRSIELNKRRPDSLIQILHIVQDYFGFIPIGLLKMVARELRIPYSRAYGVVTFYHYFSLKPKGEHNCVVCTGTACYVKGAQRIIDKIEKDFNLKSGEATADNKLGLASARCFGSCGLAPAVVIDNNLIAKAEPEQVSQLIREKLEQPQ